MKAALVTGVAVSAIWALVFATAHRGPVRAPLPPATAPLIVRPGIDPSVACEPVLLTWNLGRTVVRADTCIPAGTLCRIGDAPYWFPARADGVCYTEDGR